MGLEREIKIFEVRVGERGRERLDIRCLEGEREIRGYVLGFRDLDR